MAPSAKSSRKGSRNTQLRVILREPERKTMTSIYNTAPATAGAVGHISSIAQGDTLDARSGNQVFIKSIKILVNLISTASNNTRYIVFRDTLQQTLSPTVTDVLVSASVSSPYSGIKQVQQKRFQILWDKTISSSLNGALAHHVEAFVPVNKPIYFTGASSSSYASGTLWLLVITDVAASMTHEADFQLVYHDL